jgi:hypothetical protein
MITNGIITPTSRRIFVFSTVRPLSRKKLSYNYYKSNYNTPRPHLQWQGRRFPVEKRTNSAQFPQPYIRFKNISPAVPDR